METNTVTVGRTILWLEVAAFGLLIAMSWADEVFGVPALLFGGSHQPDFREACVETLVILVVAIPVVLRTRRVVERLFYLEHFLRVCAWCQKVEHEGDWVPIAEFFQERFDAKTSHGICPNCFAAQGGVAGVA